MPALIELNCGTGAGGFARGNTCWRGANPAEEPDFARNPNVRRPVTARGGEAAADRAAAREQYEARLSGLTPRERAVYRTAEANGQDPRAAVEADRARSTPAARAADAANAKHSPSHKELQARAAAFMRDSPVLSYREAWEMAKRGTARA